MPTKSKDTDVERFEMIAPLLNDALDPFERRRELAQIMEKYDVSESTIYLFMRKYRKDGLKGLMPKPRPEKGVSRTISETILQKAAELREELPSRSIRLILHIMEGEHIITPGQIPRSTLNRLLAQRGYSTSDLQQGEKPTVRGSKRFQRKFRNDLWQLDSKDGPTLVDPITGRKTKTSVITAIDDATRNIMCSKFYDNERTETLEDCYRTGIMMYGKPKTVFVDNGGMYISNWFRKANASIGVHYSRTLPYHPASKGKIEKFNGFINEFLHELSLQPVHDIDELNRVYKIWLEEGYRRKKHSALTYVDENGKKVERTPLEAYTTNPGKVTFVPTEELRRAFMWEKTRKVDNAGCFSFDGRPYEAGIDLCGKNINVRYDPTDTRILEVWHSGKFHRNATVLGEFPEFLPKNPRIPKAVKAKPDHSRAIGVMAKANAKRTNNANVTKETFVADEVEQKEHKAVISFVEMEEKSNE